MWLAVGSAAVGGLLLVGGPMVGVATGAPPGFLSWPLLAVLALGPVAVAAGYAARDRPAVVSALLAMLAVIALGRVIGDLELVFNAGLLSRPELLLATTALRPTAATGTWLLLAGHLCMVLAGVLGTGLSVQREDSEDVSRGLLAWSVLIALVAAVGLSGVPFLSDDVFLPATGVLDGPMLVLVGGLVVVLAVPLGVAVAVSSGSSELVRGGLLGSGLAVLAMAVPPAVASLAIAGLHPAPGPFCAVAAACVLIVLAHVTVPVRSGLPETATPRTVVKAARERKMVGWHGLAGVLGIVAGGTAVLGAQLPSLSVPGGVAPVDYASRLLGPSGVLVGLLGFALLFRRLATAIRPAFTVLCVSIPFVAMGLFDAGLSATSIGSVESGVGTRFVWLSVIVVVAAAVAAAVAGVFEREDVDVSQFRPRTVLVAPVTLATVLAVGAFGLPTVTAADYQAPGLWSNVREVASTGLLVALVVVALAGMLALRSRPARGASLLFGAAGVVAVRTLEFPLTGGRVSGASVGVGTWLAVACLASLLVGAVMALAAEARFPAETADNVRVSAERRS